MKKYTIRHSALFFVLVVLLVGYNFHHTFPLQAQVHVGGKVIYTYQFPCLSPPLGFWTLTLSTLPTVAPVPVTYPYVPVAVAKAHFLPATPGVTTFSTGPPGVCKTFFICPSLFSAGICPLLLPSASTSIQYGSAIGL